MEFNQSKPVVACFSACAACTRAKGLPGLQLQCELPRQEEPLRWSIHLQERPYRVGQRLLPRVYYSAAPPLRTERSLVSSRRSQLLVNTAGGSDVDGCLSVGTPEQAGPTLE